MVKRKVGYEMSPTTDRMKIQRRVEGKHKEPSGEHVVHDQEEKRMGGVEEEGMERLD
jgi:hypothetical protein